MADGEMIAWLREVLHRCEKQGLAGLDRAPVVVGDLVKLLAEIDQRDTASG